VLAGIVSLSRWKTVDGDLPDRTILITGGTGALGSAVVAAFLEAGWRTVVTWVDPRELERVEEREGLVLVEAGLFDEGAVQSAVDGAAQDASAPLRAVANLVGGYAGGSRVHETQIEDFERQFRFNLRPTFLVTRAALPHMLEAGGGSVVCVSTRAALEPFAGASGYIASKAAVSAFAQAVAVEYRDEGVRCNAILPSVIDTPANRASQPDADHSRWVPPADIARVVRFLCSDDSSPTSGAAIPVYGRA
jgi:NAD(P)-dependent dehydrogenase (short-subunit alcohol dehydrogenase family)